MLIPTNTTMREVKHGHGDRGMAVYRYADTTGLGVRVESRRAAGSRNWTETWWHAALPGREFKTFAELQAAAAPLTEADVAEEAGKYPRFRSVEPDACGNRCRLCPREPYEPGPRKLYDTTRVSVAVNWMVADDRAASLCGEHLQKFYPNDPAGLLAALDAEVAARRARAKPLLPALDEEERHA